MRYIDKSNKLSDASCKLIKISKNEPKGVGYSSLSENDRVLLRGYLIGEQACLCAYCMKKITIDNAHVEHIRPQSKYPNDSLDYTNLVASCNAPDTCGNKKGDWYEVSFVAPTDRKCETEFRYLSSGKMEAKSASGENTIDVLNLNSYKLRQARKQAIDNFLGIIDGEITICETIEMCKEINAHGSLPQFCNAVSWFLQNIK